MGRSLEGGSRVSHDRNQKTPISLNDGRALVLGLGFRVSDLSILIIVFGGIP